MHSLQEAQFAHFESEREDRRRPVAIEDVRNKHGVAFGGETAGHAAACIANTKDVRQVEDAGPAAFRFRVNQEAVSGTVRSSNLDGFFNHAYSSRVRRKMSILPDQDHFHRDRYRGRISFQGVEGTPIPRGPSRPATRDENAIGFRGLPIHHLCLPYAPHCAFISPRTVWIRQGTLLVSTAPQRSGEIPHEAVMTVLTARNSAIVALVFLIAVAFSRERGQAQTSPEQTAPAKSAAQAAPASPSRSHHEIDVPATKQWVDTNIDLRSGAKVRFTATGQITYSRDQP